MRRHDDVVEPEQRPVVRLGGEDVESGTCELAGRERLRQSLLVDQPSAGGVDDPRAVLHLRDRVAIDHPPGLVGQGRVQGEEVGAAEDLVLGERVLDTELPEALVRDERVVGDDLHAEADGSAGNLLADPAETEHPEGLALELDSTPPGPLPTTLLERRVRLRDVARECHHQADRLLGGRDDRRLGRVRNDDAAAGGSLDVDVVDADPGAPDHLEVRGEIDQVGREPRRRANHDRVVPVDDLLERRHLVLVDVELRPEQVDSGIGDLLAHEDPHRQTAVSYAARAAAPAAPRSTVAPISTS